MLTDIAIKALKPKGKLYKVADRDGMRAAATKIGSKTFHLDYRIFGRRETVTLWRYRPMMNLSALPNFTSVLRVDWNRPA